MEQNEPVTRSKGRQKGAVNYQNELLLDIIEEVLPVGNEDWQVVAARYRSRSSEIAFRSAEDIKRHYMDKLCMKFKKPTGASTLPPLAHRAQELYSRILTKESCGVFGDSDEYNEGSDEDFTPEEADLPCFVDDLEGIEALQKARSSTPLTESVSSKKRSMTFQSEQKTKNSKIVSTAETPRQQSKKILTGNVDKIAEGNKMALKSSIDSSTMMMFMMQQQQQQQQQMQQQMQQQ